MSCCDVPAAPFSDIYRGMALIGVKGFGALPKYCGVLMLVFFVSGGCWKHNSCACARPDAARPFIPPTAQRDSQLPYPVRAGCTCALLRLLGP